jgi:hypothetical protein
MEFHKKYVLPKVEVPDTVEFAKYIRERLLRGLVEGLEPYAQFEEREEATTIPELAGSVYNQTKNYICTLDVCLPTKLLPLDGTGRFYQCQQCLRNISKFTGEHVNRYGVDMTRMFDLKNSVGKYCPDCGSRFTNLHRDEFGYLYVKEEE